MKSKKTLYEEQKEGCLDILDQYYAYLAKYGEHPEVIIPAFRVEADNGDGDLAYFVAVCYFNGYPVSQDYSLYWEYCGKAIEAGNIFAMFSRALSYNNGCGVELDYSKAFYWFNKAAEAGLVDGLFKLGDCYMNGQGVKKDYVKAIQCYRKAALQGQPIAQYILWTLYSESDNEKNRSMAWNMLKMSADNGFSTAQAKYGRSVIDDNYEQGLKYLKRSATQGDDTGRAYLGFVYLCAPNTYNKGKKLLLRSVNNGSVEAMTLLAVHYKNRGDLDSAEMWVEKAAKFGCDCSYIIRAAQD